MSISEPSEIAYRTLPDSWMADGPIPLDGTLERHQFPPLLTAFIGLVAGFVLFQLVISPVAIVGLLLLRGMNPVEMIDQFQTIIQEQTDVLLTANSIGQLFGLAIPAFVLARLHTSRPWALLRFRRSDALTIGLGVVGLLALTPLVQWLGTMNESLPLPDVLRELEQSQMELIEQVLQSDLGFTFNLLVLAVTPAICEELFFRGYVQRQAERGLGIAGGVLFSGIVFGLYHLRLTQVLPLSVLGIYLAYLVWQTGSLWAPIVVHFANNALSVAIGAYASSDSELSIAAIESVDIPWYIAFIGALLFVLIMYGLQQWISMQHAARTST